MNETGDSKNNIEIEQSGDILNELHPCCLKELMNNKLKASVDVKLRAQDRSYARMDATKGIFQDLRNYGSKCNCCRDSCDYPSLVRYRSTLEESKAFEASHQDSSADESDCDLEFEDFLTPYEEERLQRIVELEKKRRFAEGLGFGAHVEESVEHLCELVTSGCSAVVHFFNDDGDSARFDYVLENLAKLYIGTIFRRVRNDGALHSQMKQILSVQTKRQFYWNDDARLCVFVDSELRRSLRDSEVRTEMSEIVKILDHTHVLRSDIDSRSIDMALRKETHDVNEADDERTVTNSYCENPNCRFCITFASVSNTIVLTKFLRFLVDCSLISTSPRERVRVVCFFVELLEDKRVEMKHYKLTLSCDFEVRNIEMKLYDDIVTNSGYD
jgi:hypothetical protein